MDVPENDPELKKTKTFLTVSSTLSPMIRRIERFSDWNRAVMAIAVLFQYISRKRKQGDITRGEAKQKAIIAIVKWAQEEAFFEVTDSLKPRTSTEEEPVKITGKSHLSPLNPYLDDQQILRVGGRLDRSSLSDHVKHPIILPRKGRVTTLIIKWCHEQVAHQGRGITMKKVRSSGFWIVNCSSAVTSHIFKCVQCRKLRGKANTQRMADLPKDRLEPSPPFTYCGMDCFGPFVI